MKYTEIENCEALRIALEAGGTLRHYAFQGIDFNKCMDMAMQCRFSDCLFLGGFGVDNLRDRMDDSCSIFPRFQGLPFRAFRSGLYSAKSLYEGYRPGDPDSYKDCYDSKVYEHYLKAGKQTGDIKETLARILHDHSMNDGLDDFLRFADFFFDGLFADWAVLDHIHHSQQQVESTLSQIEALLSQLKATQSNTEAEITRLSAALDELVRNAQL